MRGGGGKEERTPTHLHVHGQRDQNGSLAQHITVIVQNVLSLRMRFANKTRGLFYSCELVDDNAHVPPGSTFWYEGIVFIGISVITV